MKIWVLAKGYPAAKAFSVTGRSTKHEATYIVACKATNATFTDCQRVGMLEGSCGLRVLTLTVTMNVCSWHASHGPDKLEVIPSNTLSELVMPLT